MKDRKKERERERKSAIYKKHLLRDDVLKCKCDRERERERE